MLLLEILLATQLYLPFSPTVVSTNQVFSSYSNANNLLENLVVNVADYNFSVQEQILEMIASRDLDLGFSIYDVQQRVNVPFRYDLNLKYSLFATSINLNSSAIRIYLSLTNTTHVILLGYHVGHLEGDRIPEPTAPTYMYAFYQLDNKSNSWINGQRNISNDLTEKGIIIESDNWSIERLILGFWSFRNSSDNLYSGKFNLTETSLFYDDLTNVKITSTSPQFSILVASLMVCDLFLVITFLFIARRMKVK